MEQSVKFNFPERDLFEIALESLRINLTSFDGIRVDEELGHINLQGGCIDFEIAHGICEMHLGQKEVG